MSFFIVIISGGKYPDEMFEQVVGCFDSIFNAKTCCRHLIEAVVEEDCIFQIYELEKNHFKVTWKELTVQQKEPDYEFSIEIERNGFKYVKAGTYTQKGKFNIIEDYKL